MHLSLSRKPDAVAWSIEDLLERVRAGQIRLPDFQRLYKWEGKDVLELFDSIIRGFPIGTLLFWKGPSTTRAKGRDLETTLASGEAPRSEVQYWVLDGQQRITSLAGVLLASGEPNDDRFRIAFDLEHEGVVGIPAGARTPERSVPLWYVLDSVNLLSWLQTQPQMAPVTKRRVLEIGKSIREYRVPAYIVDAEDEGTARMIYDRTNATGKPLTKPEVFKALHDGFRTLSPSSLPELQASISDLEFGQFPEDLYLQAAAAVAGLDVTKIDHAALATPALGEALPLTAAALRASVVFLRRNAHIPNKTLLPYSFPLLALTRFFHFFPEPNARSRELLSRWVWRGALSQKHHSHEHKYVRETLREITGADEDGEVQRMLSLLPKTPGSLTFGEYNLRSSQTRLLLLALLDLRPRDLATGGPLDGASLIHRAKSDAVPPLVDLPAGDVAEDAARSTVFGRIIQPPMPRARLVELLSSLLVDDDLLGSLGMDRQDARAVLANRPEHFARRRMERLMPHVTAFFERRARWEQGDRPSLGSLTVEDEP